MTISFSRAPLLIVWLLRDCRSSGRSTALCAAGRSTASRRGEEDEEDEEDEEEDEEEEEEQEGASRTTGRHSGSRTGRISIASSATPGEGNAGCPGASWSAAVDIIRTSRHPYHRASRSPRRSTTTG